MAPRLPSLDPPLVSLVHSRLDYGNFVLVRLPAYLQRQLQSVLNSAARLIYRLRGCDYVTDALTTLHWLRLPERVDFKVAVMAFRVLHGLAPPYLGSKPVGLCRRPSGPSPTSLSDIIPTARPIFPTVINCRSPVVSS